MTRPFYPLRAPIAASLLTLAADGGTVVAPGMVLLSTRGCTHYPQHRKSASSQEAYQQDQRKQPELDQIPSHHCRGVKRTG